MPLPRVYYTSPRGQCAVMLLAALRDLYVIEARRIVTKTEAISYIRENHWFALESSDHDPYPSQRLATSEPRWHTLIAWARKDFVLRDMISHEARDAWGLTRTGRDAIDRFHALCVNGERPVTSCFLWSPTFKRFMLPLYVPSASDAKRPSFFYRDTFVHVFEGY